VIALQILVDGFAISALYALGATGFALIFGVSGVLNLSHGALMVAAAVAAWAADNLLAVHGFGAVAMGVVTALILALVNYFLVVRPVQRSGTIRPEEKELFILTATLLFGILIQELIAYCFTNNAKTVLPLVVGVTNFAGVRIPINEVLTAAICLSVIGSLWLFVNRTPLGKIVLASSMNPRGVTLLGIDLSWIYLWVWSIYGILCGIAGVLIGMTLGISSYSVGPLTASAFSIVVLGGLGSVTGSVIASFIVGYIETSTAYLISPTYRFFPSLILLVLVMYVRPNGLLGRR
jgi:branched-chain amino acid transport system permease protein